MSTFDLSVSLTNWQAIERTAQTTHDRAGAVVLDLVRVMSETLTDPTSPMAGRMGDEPIRFVEGLLGAADLIAAVSAALTKNNDRVSAEIAACLAGSLGITAMRLWRDAE